MDLLECRAKIDEIDRQVVSLFLQRMDIVVGVAAYKKEHNRPVHDPVREQAKLDALRAMVPEQMQPYIVRLYETMFAVSRDYEHQLLGE